MRIVLPEHHDRRYVFTIINASDSSVIIDALYSFVPTDENEAPFIHAGLNSLLAWYQVELRGRSQHGEGVLKVKLPDYRGILLANPATITPKWPGPNIRVTPHGRLPCAFLSQLGFSLFGS